MSKMGGVNSGKNALLTLFIKSFYFILTFVIGVIVARAIGPEGKGIYSLILLTSSIGAVIVGLGVPVSNSCLVGKHMEHPALAVNEKTSSLATNSLLLIIGVIILLACIYASLQFSKIFEPTTLKYVGIAFVVIPFLLLISLFAELLHGMNKILEFNLVLVFVPLLQLIVLLTLIKGLTLSAVLMSWAISQIIGVGIVSFILFKNTKVGVPDFSLLKSMLAFGLQVWGVQLIGALNLRFDTYLVAYYVGYYSVAVTIANFLFYIPSSIAIVILPRLTSSDSKTASDMACRGLRVSIFSSALLLILFMGIGKFIIPAVYGKMFIPSIVPLFILLPGSAIFGLAHITTTYFNAYIGKPIINTGLASLSLVINIGLNVVLIPKFGVNGAALSCTISYILSMMVSIYIFLRLSKVRLNELLSIRIADIREYLRILREVRPHGTLNKHSKL
jgi:O-antigen/teichoic acid export membrane protein